MRDDVHAETNPSAVIAAAGQHRSWEDSGCSGSHALEGGELRASVRRTGAASVDTNNLHKIGPLQSAKAHYKALQPTASV